MNQIDNGKPKAYQLAKAEWKYIKSKNEQPLGVAVIYVGLLIVGELAELRKVIRNKT